MFGPASATQQCGAFRLGSPDDSALLIRLERGAYTALVSGVNDTTGNALIEVYLME